MDEKQSVHLSTNMIRIEQDEFREFIGEAQIQKRVRELGAEIEQDYLGSHPIFIGILNGSFVFLSDLIRAIEAIDLEVDFYKLSSYGNEKISSGQIRLLKSIDANIENRDVLVVEDIVDSGLSVHYIRKEILKHNPKSLRFCTLLLKEEVANLEFELDYVGFRIPKQFVIGYGLDYKQLKRNLKSIYSLNQEL